MIVTILPTAFTINLLVFVWACLRQADIVASLFMTDLAKWETLNFGFWKMLMMMPHLLYINENNNIFVFSPRLNVANIRNSAE
jgi:hypothetical protein